MAHGATASVAFRVMELKALEDLRLILSECYTGLMAVCHVEDLADLLARRLFVGNREVEAIEARFWTPTPSKTVRETYHSFAELDLAYCFICVCRGRSSVLGGYQQRDVFVNQLPPKVTQLLRQQPFFPSMMLEELHDRARELEEAVSPASPQVYFKDDEAMDGQPVKRLCPGCNQAGHLKKNCPHAKDRYAKCGAIGHISLACKGSVVPDCTGRARIIVRPHVKGSTTHTLFDNQRPDQIKTAT